VKKIVQAQQCFFFNLSAAQKVVSEYRAKYEAIDTFLDEHADILKAVHTDLARFGSSKGRGATFSSEQVLRMSMVMCIEQLSYRDTIVRVAESDFLRNFTRIGVGKVMSFAFLCDAFKHISAATWQKINDSVLRSAHAAGAITPEKLRVDSTVCESTIHYPTDCSLLWDTYRVIARTIRYCSAEAPEWNMGNRFHDKKIKKLFTYIATHAGKANRSTKRKVKRCMRTLVERVEALCETAQGYVANAHRVPTASLAAPALLAELEHYLPLGRHVVDQSRRAQLLGEKVPASERIFSIFEEHTELLKRGKAQKPVEFGHMVTIGQTEEKFISFYDVRQKSLHDSALKDIALEHHRTSFGAYPERFTADKNYYTSMDDIESWEEKIEFMAIGKKGRRDGAELAREHSDIFRELQRFRAGVEGSISVLKRAFGLRRCRFKGFSGFAASIGCLVLCHNLVLLSRL